MSDTNFKPQIQDSVSAASSEDGKTWFGFSRRKAILSALGVMAVAGVAGITIGVISNGSGELNETGFSLLPDGKNFENWDQLYPPYNQVGDEEEDIKLFAKFEQISEKFYFKAKPPTGHKLGKTNLIYFNLDQDRNTPEDVAQDVPRGTEFYLEIALSPNGVAVSNIPWQFYEGCRPFEAENDDECKDGTLACCRKLLGSIPNSDRFSSSSERSVEFTVTKSTLSNFAPGVIVDQDIGISALFSKLPTNSDPTEVFTSMPLYFQNWFPVYSGIDSLPECSNGEEVRAAIVFSEDSARNFFDRKSYSNLFMSLQSQLFQAGIPHDRIDMDSVFDLEALCSYDFIVIPSIRVINEGKISLLRRNLFFAIHYYGVGVIFAGDLGSTNAETTEVIGGDPYFLMKELIGIGNDFPVYMSASSNSVRLVDTQLTTMFSDLNEGDILLEPEFATRFANMYVKASKTIFEVVTIAEQDLVNATGTFPFNAILSSHLPDIKNPFGKSSGRVVHFSTTEVMANRDLVWRAANWVAAKSLGSVTKFGLLLGRQSSIFMMRVDCDQSMFSDEVLFLYPAYTEILREWFETFNLVGAQYINLGFNPSENEETNWDATNSDYSPNATYHEWLSLENEIGCHSYTHPENISELAYADLEFEFKEAMKIIKEKVYLDRIGSAQPGNPPNIETYFKVAEFMKDTYWGDSYSGVGAGYPNAFGFATVTGRDPKISNDEQPGPVYMAPNMYFDFSLNGYQNKTPEEAEAAWIDQFNQYNSKLSNFPVLLWPIHDYGPTNWDDEHFLVGEKKRSTGGDMYSRKQFDSLIALAHSRDAEFITPMQFSDRIRAFDSSSLLFEKLGENDYKVVTTGENMGGLSLQLQSAPGKVIHSISDWFAYSSERVFHPRVGRTFLVKVASEPNATPPTHISKLDMRMDLISCSGDGLELNFTVHGRGNVTVDLFPEFALKNIFAFSGAGNVELTGTQAIVNLPTLGEHSVSVTVIPTASPTAAPTDAPTKTPTVSPTDAPTKTPTKAPTDAPTFAPTLTPTAAPTKTPTISPTDAPTAAPTITPTLTPTEFPTFTPTVSPTHAPTKSPTETPTSGPTATPTEGPTQSPTVSPTSAPTTSPTQSPTSEPTGAPTTAPTDAPTAPTNTPTTSPTSSPTLVPTNVGEGNTPSTDAQGNQTPQDDSGISGGAVAGIVLGVLALGAVGGGVYYKRKNAGIDAVGAPPSIEQML